MCKPYPTLAKPDAAYFSAAITMPPIGNKARHLQAERSWVRESHEWSKAGEYSKVFIDCIKERFLSNLFKGLNIKWL